MLSNTVLCGCIFSFALMKIAVTVSLDLTQHAPVRLSFVILWVQAFVFCNGNSAQTKAQGSIS